MRWGGKTAEEAGLGLPGTFWCQDLGEEEAGLHPLRGDDEELAPGKGRAATTLDSMALQSSKAWLNFLCFGGVVGISRSSAVNSCISRVSLSGFQRVSDQITRNLTP
jgi:hypothetical protein